MKTGIIGLPKVGKTFLFEIFTPIRSDEPGNPTPREAPELATHRHGR